LADFLAIWALFEDVRKSLSEVSYTFRNLMKVLREKFSKSRDMGLVDQEDQKTKQKFTVKAVRIRRSNGFPKRYLQEKQFV
jgi:hypothetical protein